jgi:hypothetical protein
VGRVGTSWDELGRVGTSIFIRNAMDTASIVYDFNIFNDGIKSLRATLPVEIFYWGF